MNLWIIGLGLIGVVVVRLILKSNSNISPAASAPQTTRPTVQEMRSEGAVNQRAPSNEIPIPENFEFHHRGGRRVSEKQRRLRQARRRREAEIQAAVLKQLGIEAELQRKMELRQYTKVSRDRLPKGYSAQWIREQRDRQGGLCFWCSRKLTEAKNHLDHVWPLSLGGHHDVANLVVACSPCNLDKGSQNPWDFVDRLHMRMNLAIVESGDDPFSASSIMKDQENKLLSAQFREDLRECLSEMGIADTPSRSRQTESARGTSQLELEFEIGACYSVALSEEGTDVLTLFDID